jgi:hypothetical protein
VVAVRKGVFGVELELVHAQELEQVDELSQRVQGRHPVARDVEHVAAHGEIGPVAKPQAGQLARALARELDQRARAPVQPARIARDQAHAVRRDRELEALRGERERSIDRSSTRRGLPPRFAMRTRALETGWERRRLMTGAGLPPGAAPRLEPAPAAAAASAAPFIRSPLANDG